MHARELIKLVLAEAYRRSDGRVDIRLGGEGDEGEILVDSLRAVIAREGEIECSCDGLACSYLTVDTPLICQ